MDRFLTDGQQKSQRLYQRIQLMFIRNLVGTYLVAMTEHVVDGLIELKGGLRLKEAKSSL